MQLEQNKQVMKLVGKIDFDSVVALKVQGESLIQKGQPVEFDFSEVLECDSSALALLIAYRRAALKHQINVDFLKVPQSLLALAGLCNVTSLVTAK